MHLQTDRQTDLLTGALSGVEQTAAAAAAAAKNESMLSIDNEENIFNDKNSAETFNRAVLEMRQIIDKKREKSAEVVKHATPPTSYATVMMRDHQNAVLPEQQTGEALREVAEKVCTTVIEKCGTAGDQFVWPPRVEFVAFEPVYSAIGMYRVYPLISRCALDIVALLQIVKDVRGKGGDAPWASTLLYIYFILIFNGYIMPTALREANRRLCAWKNLAGHTHSLAYFAGSGPNLAPLFSKYHEPPVFTTSHTAADGSDIGKKYAEWKCSSAFELGRYHSRVDFNDMRDLDDCGDRLAPASFAWFMCKMAYYAPNITNAPPVPSLLRIIAAFHKSKSHSARLPPQPPRPSNNVHSGSPGGTVLTDAVKHVATHIRKSFSGSVMPWAHIARIAPANFDLFYGRVSIDFRPPPTACSLAATPCDRLHRMLLKGVEAEFGKKLFHFFCSEMAKKIDNPRAFIYMLSYAFIMSSLRNTGTAIDMEAMIGYQMMTTHCSRSDAEQQLRSAFSVPDAAKNRIAIAAKTLAYPPCMHYRYNRRNTEQSLARKVYDAVADIHGISVDVVKMLTIACLASGRSTHSGGSSSSTTSTLKYTDFTHYRTQQQQLPDDDDDNDDNDVVSLERRPNCSANRMLCYRMCCSKSPTLDPVMSTSGQCVNPYHIVYVSKAAVFERDRVIRQRRDELLLKEQQFVRESFACMHAHSSGATDRRQQPAPTFADTVACARDIRYHDKLESVCKELSPAPRCCQKTLRTSLENLCQHLALKRNVKIGLTDEMLQLFAHFDREKMNWYRKTGLVKSAVPLLHTTTTKCDCYGVAYWLSVDNVLFKRMFSEDAVLCKYGIRVHHVIAFCLAFYPGHPVTRAATNGKMSTPFEAAPMGKEPLLLLTPPSEDIFPRKCDFGSDYCLHPAHRVRHFAARDDTTTTTSIM